MGVGGGDTGGSRGARCAADRARASEIYPIPVALEALIVASAWELELRNMVNGVIAVAAILGLRTAALMFHWRTAGAWRG
jgi:hypothetical protein